MTNKIIALVKQFVSKSNSIRTMAFDSWKFAVEDREKGDKNGYQTFSQISHSMIEQSEQVIECAYELGKLVGAKIKLDMASNLYTLDFEQEIKK